MTSNEIKEEKYVNLVVQSIYDQQLEQENDLLPHSYYIQAGAALTQERIGDFYDNEGEDNISQLNKQFCELTVMYWAWKHVKTDYIGIAHYRRSFQLTEEELIQAMNEGVDAVFPTIVAFNASMEEQYKIASFSDAFDEMLNVIFEKYPQYYGTAVVVTKENRFIPYNMGIMKKDYYDDYCEWMFTILFQVYDRIGDKRDVYQNRYCAFLAERMTLIYATYHASKKTYGYAQVVQSETRNKVEEQFLSLPQSETNYVDFVNPWIKTHNIRPIAQLHFYREGTEGILPYIDLFSALIHASHLEMRHQADMLFDYYDDVYTLLKDYIYIIEEMKGEKLYKDANVQQAFFTFLTEHHVSGYTLAYLAVVYQVSLSQMAQLLFSNGDEQTARFLISFESN